MPTTNFTQAQILPYLYGYWPRALATPGQFNAGLDGSGIVLTVTGTQLVIAGAVSGVGNTPFVATVDGTTTNPAVTTGPIITVFTGLADTAHQVWLHSHVGGGYSPNNVKLPSAVTFQVTGAAPAIGYATGYGPASALIPSSAFGQYGYALAGSMAWPATDGLSATPAQYDATLIGMSQQAGVLQTHSTSMTMCFNAQTNAIGITNLSNYHGVHPTNSWAFGVILKGELEAWRGEFKPTDPTQKIEPVAWALGLDNSQFFDWTVILGGACTLATNASIAKMLCPTVVLGSGGAFGSRPPQRRQTALYDGDSRTEGNQCGDGQCDQTRSWCYHLSRSTGIDFLIHGASGSVLHDHVAGGTFDTVAAAKNMIPSTFDHIMSDLGTNNGDWAANYGSSNATYQAAYTAYVNSLKVLLNPGGKIWIIVPNSNTTRSTDKPASDSSMQINWNIRQSYYMSFATDPQVGFVDLSCIEGTQTLSPYNTCLNLVGSGGHQSNTNHRQQADRIWLQMQKQVGAA